VNDIVILPELRDLISTLTEEEHELLESSIADQGCRDPLCVWRRGDETILIDGHHRYEICERLGVPYDTVPIELDDLNAAKIWMIDNQRARRNITPAYRTELELARESIYKAEAAERKAHGQTAPGRTLTQNSGEAFGRHTRETDAKIGEAAGVSRDTVAKVRKVKEAAEQDDSKRDVLRKMRTGELSVNAAFKQAVPHVSHNSGENEWYTPPEIIEAARNLMGGIDTDPATSEIANRVVQADTWYTKEDDGLTKPWTGNVWLNPPYAQPLIGQFIDALDSKYQRGEFDEACILVNNATETRWGQLLLGMSSAVCFIAGRVRFLDPSGAPGAPLQGQMLVYIGAGDARIALSSLGVVVMR